MAEGSLETDLGGYVDGGEPVPVLAFGAKVDGDLAGGYLDPLQVLRVVWRRVSVSSVFSGESLCTSALTLYLVEKLSLGHLQRLIPCDIIDEDLIVVTTTPLTIHPEQSAR